MKTAPKLVLAGTSALVLSAAAAALYFLLRAVGSFVHTPDLGPGRLALLACATVLLAAAILARGLSRRARASDPGPSPKAALYEQLLAAWCAAHRRGTPPAGPDYDELERHLVLHASRGVLNAYATVRGLGRPFNPSEAAHRSALERLLAAMRKDLGHADLPWASATAANLLFPPPASSPPLAAPPTSFKVLAPQ